MSDTDIEERTPAKLEVYSMGACHLSVCVESGLERDEVERLANLETPTGISSRWEISDEPFSSGEQNPSPCNSNPERAHYLLVC